MRIELQRVEFMPKVLEPGILYFAEEYGAAAHLCACGCGSKIRTPIGPTWWAIQDGLEGVSLTRRGTTRASKLVDVGEISCAGCGTGFFDRLTPTKQSILI